MTTRTTWPPGHIIHMSLDHSPGESISVALCDCGWISRAPWPHRDHMAAQDAAIEDHWRTVELANR